MAIPLTLKGHFSKILFPDTANTYKFEPTKKLPKIGPKAGNGQ